MVFDVLGDALPSVTSFQREVRNICGSNTRTDFVMSHEDGTRSVMEVKTVVDTDVSETRRIRDSRGTRRPQRKRACKRQVSAKQEGKKKKATKKSPKSKLTRRSSKRHPYVRAGHSSGSQTDWA